MWWDWFTHTTRCKLHGWIVVYTCTRCLAHDFMHYMHCFKHLLICNIAYLPTPLFEPNTRKMLSSSGASLRSWHQLYSSFNIAHDVLSILIEFLSCYTVLLEGIAWSNLTVIRTKKSQIHKITRQRQLGYETHRLSVWPWLNIFKLRLNVLTRPWWLPLPLFQLSVMD